MLKHLVDQIDDVVHRSSIHDLKFASLPPTLVLLKYDLFSIVFFFDCFVIVQ